MARILIITREYGKKEQWWDKRDGQKGKKWDTYDSEKDTKMAAQNF